MGGVLVDSVLGLIAVFGHNSSPSLLNVPIANYFPYSVVFRPFVPLVRPIEWQVSGNGLIIANVRFWVTADIRCYMLQVQI
jgi:hypothetical protein